MAEADFSFQVEPTECEELVVCNLQIIDRRPGHEQPLSLESYAADPDVNCGIRANHVTVVHAKLIIPIVQNLGQEVGSRPIDFRLVEWFSILKTSGDMPLLFWLSGAQMARLQPYFPKPHGKTRVHCSAGDCEAIYREETIGAC